MIKSLREEKVSDHLIGAEEFEVRYNKWKERINNIIDKNKTILKTHNKSKKTRELLKARRQIKKQISTTTDKAEREIGVKRIKLINEYIKQEENNQYKRKMEKVINKLKAEGGINGANTWEVLKKMRGNRIEKPSSIWAKDGSVLEKEEDILNRHVEHFSDLLKLKIAKTEEEKRNEKLVVDAAEKIKKIGKLSKQRKTVLEEEVKICIKELKKKKCADKEGWKNETFIYGGPEMITSLTYIINEIEKGKFIPKDWNDVIIKTVHKKGIIQDMNNKRGLFLTNVMSKIYERVIKNRNKKIIYKGISENQLGGKKGRGTTDALLIISELIRTNKVIGKKTYLIFGDAVKCFDKLWLLDSIVELYKLDVCPQDLLMVYLLNKTANITIKTPIGETESFRAEETVKQGTIWGPEICCVETDRINEIGEDCKSMISDVEVGVLGYMDDILGAGTAEKIKKVARNMRRMERLKKYTFGLEKTKYMIVNTGKEKEEEFDEELEGGKIRRTYKYEYLGFWISEEGDCSVQIERKNIKVMAEICMIKKMACKENVGNLFLSVRIFMYNMCALPSLLYGLEAWNTTEKEVMELERMQKKFLCCLLELPQTSPYWGILHETGIWSIRCRLRYRQVMLLHSILKSDENRLVKKVVRNQRGKENTFFERTVNLAKEIDIEMEDIERDEKQELKKKIKNKSKKEMEEFLRVKVKESRKLRFIKRICWETAPYFFFNEVDANRILKIRLNMVDVYDNYRGDLRKRRLCTHCKKTLDTTEHLGQCSAVFGMEEDECLRILRNDEDKGWKGLVGVVERNLNSRIK